jgi:hypothetical protein
MKQIHPTREAWLEEAMSEVSVQFKRLGFPLPKRIRVTCGFTSGGTRKRPGGKVLIGECWDSSRSGDKSFEIMVSPTEADPVRVLGILVHELAHAAAGLAAGHSGDFETLARGLHLEGPLPATTVGDAFKTQMAAPLERLGEYPHAELNTAKKDTQSTRMLLCRCKAVMPDGNECGYAVRLTAKWLKGGGKDRKDGSKESFGPPICPGNGSGHHGSMSVA